MCFCSSGFTGSLCEKKCKKVEKYFDVVFVVDGSGSLDPNAMSDRTCNDPNPHAFQQELEFVDDVIETLEIGTTKSRVAFIQFATRTMKEISLVESGKLGKAKLMSQVKQIQWSAGLAAAKCTNKKNVGFATATPAGMALAQTLFKTEGRMDDKNVVKMMFVVTDGTISGYLSKENGRTGRNALEVAQDLNKMGVQTYSIGVSVGSGDKSAIKEDLLKIAGGNEAHRFLVSNFDYLKKQVLGTIQNALNCDV